MHPILADSLGPGLLWILILLAGIACTIIAIAGLFPAALGRVRLALTMAAPALLFSFITTALLIFFWSTSGATPESPEDATDDRHDFLKVWILFAGIPLALSVFVALLAWLCGTIRQKNAK